MKIARHAKIIDLISRNDVETQEELADLLNGEGIRELKLTKISLNDGRQKYAVMQASRENMNEKYLRILKDGFLSMDMAQNILVVKTVSGMAMAVAASIDAMQWPEVAGCIAGDDTIMCANRSVDDTLLVMEKIRKIVGEPNE